MIRVLHLLDKRFPPDIRLEREARTLAKAGYEVHALVRAANGNSIPAGISQIHVLPRRRRWPLLGGRDLRYLTTFVDGAWLDAASALCASIRPALVHAHDLPLAHTALAVGRRHGIPVVLDYRENWPAALQVWRAASPARGLSRARGRLVSLVHECGPRYRSAEISAAREAAAVFVVVEENLKRLESAGVPRERLVLMRNAFDPADLEGDAGELTAPASPFIIVYAGDLALFRGVQDVIAALPRVLAREPRAVLLVLGDGVGRGSLEEEARRLGLAAAVRFTGWLPNGAVGAALAAASVGVVPHHKNAHTDTTMPNKIFQYMAAGLPVVTSDAAPLARVVRETGCGRVARTGDADAYASALCELAEPAEHDRAARAARTAVRLWADEAPALLSVYGRLAGGAR